MSGPRESNMDGTLHVSGECCGDGLNELRCRATGCAGTMHNQGTALGLMLSCDVCPRQSNHWVSRGTYRTDDMVGGSGRAGSSLV